MRQSAISTACRNRLHICADSRVGMDQIGSQGSWRQPRCAFLVSVLSLNYRYLHPWQTEDCPYSVFPCAERAVSCAGRNPSGPAPGLDLASSRSSPMHWPLLSLIPSPLCFNQATRPDTRLRSSRSAGLPRRCECGSSFLFTMNMCSDCIASPTRAR
jgi:hypothetical protein